MTGYALATALAAPVEDGMMFALAARPARQSPFMLPSTVQLGGGRGVHGGHEALLDAELLVDHLHQGREAVGRARRARHNRHRGVVLILVDANHQGGGVRILGGRGDDDLLGAALDVLHAALGRGERAGRLAHVLDASVLPRDLGRVTGGRQGDRQAVDDETIVLDLEGAREAAVHGVVLEQVLHVLRGHGRVNVLEDERVA